MAMEYKPKSSKGLAESIADFETFKRSVASTGADSATQRQEQVRDTMEDQGQETMDRASALLEKLAGEATGQSAIKSPIEAESMKRQGQGAGSQATPAAVSVAPASFSVAHSKMGGLDSFTTIMTMRQLIDFTELESELYAVDGKLTQKQLKAVSVLERFQRNLDSGRITDIAGYVRDVDQHYFGAILCVPASESVYQALLALIAANGNNTVASITLAPHCMFIIDGQHRREGIRRAIEDLTSRVKSLRDSVDLLRREKLGDKETQADRDASVTERLTELSGVAGQLERLMSESMPVTLVNMKPVQADGSNGAVNAAMIQRQQLFSDINKTPHKVSVSLAKLYDHASAATQLAKYVSGVATADFGSGYKGLTWAVNYESTSPRKKENKIMTLNNVETVIKPDKKSKTSRLLGAIEAGHLTHENVAAMVHGIVSALPESGEMEDNSIQFQSLIGRYVCFNSVFWQSVGYLVSEQIFVEDRKEAKEAGSGQYASVVDRIVGFVQQMTDSDSWDAHDSIWTDDSSPVVDREFHVPNKQGTVKNMVSVLRSEFQGDTDSDSVSPDEE